MKNIAIGTVVVLVGIFLALFFVFRAKTSTSTKNPKPTPTLEQVEQLPPDKAPKVSLSFSKDGHYVTVDLTGVYADQLEYNLIYDATVKGNKIQTGVNATAKLEGKTTYSRQQLLGSESSGKFTYHASIENGTLELTLRDAGNHSIYSATYPFVFSAGNTIPLEPSQ